jgi:hypothetical protein
MNKAQEYKYRVHQVYRKTLKIEGPRPKSASETEKCSDVSTDEMICIGPSRLWDPNSSTGNTRHCILWSVLAEWRVLSLSLPSQSSTSRHTIEVDRLSSIFWKLLSGYGRLVKAAKAPLNVSLLRVLYGPARNESSLVVNEDVIDNWWEG